MHASLYGSSHLPVDALTTVSTPRALSVLQSARPLAQPRAMYGPRMTWVGTSLAPWTGLNAT
jgi:hypothetical protein